MSKRSTLIGRQHIFLSLSLQVAASDVILLYRVVLEANNDFSQTWFCQDCYILVWFICVDRRNLVKFFRTASWCDFRSKLVFKLTTVRFYFRIITCLQLFRKIIVINLTWFKYFWWKDSLFDNNLYLSVNNIVFRI